MNPSEAKAILKYIKVNASENEKICKALRTIKEKISEDPQNSDIFR